MRESCLLKRFLLLLLLSASFPLFCQVVVDSRKTAVSIAVANSKEQLFQQQLAQEEVRYARLSIQHFLPQLGFSYSESDSVKVGMADSRTKSLQLTVSQLVFDGGQGWNHYQVGNLSSRYRYQQAVQLLDEFKGRVLECYQRILLQQQVVDIKKRLKEDGLARLKIIGEELVLGLVREIDYLDYEVSCRRLAQEERLAGEELARQLVAFRQLLGLDQRLQVMVVPKTMLEEELQEVVCDSPEATSIPRQLAPYLQELLMMSLSHSPALKLQQLEYSAQVQQEQLGKRWYLPNLTLEGSLSLSGTEFPLREPDFSLRLKMSFDRNPFLPLTNTTSLGFDKERLRSLGNSVSVTVNPNVTYFSQQRLSSIRLLQQQLSLAISREQLEQSVRELVLEYDNHVESVSYARESLEIQRRKVAIGQQQLENGEMTEMDYLQWLVELSTMEIQLVELESAMDTLLWTVELAAGIAPGGIDEVLFN